MTQFSLFLVINNHEGGGNVITFGARGDFDHMWYMGMAFSQFGPDTIGMAGGVGNVFGWIHAGMPRLAAPSWAVGGVR